jgi:hypothetical protein
MKRCTVVTCALVAFGLIAVWYLIPGKGDAQLGVTWERNDWATETVFAPEGPRRGQTIWFRNLNCLKIWVQESCSSAAIYSRTARPSILEIEWMAKQAASSAGLSPGEDTSMHLGLDDPSNIRFLIVFTHSPTVSPSVSRAVQRYPWLKPIFPLPYTAIELPPKENRR